MSQRMTAKLRRVLNCLLTIIPTLLPIKIVASDSAPARTQKIAEVAEALRPKLIEIRRDFHRHPELSNREERTARIVAEKLRALGFDEVRTNVAKHGVVALLRGSRSGPVVALRADMDALPINETISRTSK